MDFDDPEDSDYQEDSLDHGIEPERRYHGQKTKEQRKRCPKNYKSRRETVIALLWGPQWREILDPPKFPVPA